MVFGVTGGVGTGKSTVLNILENRYGFMVIRTDDVARELMSGGTECLKELVSCFGSQILNESGELDKRKYSAIIYSSDENRKKSDSIVHPRVWEEVLKRIRSTDRPVAVETALPSQAFSELCDKVILVHVDTETRIERLMKDRGYTRDYAEGIIKAQLSNADFMKYSDYVLDNSHDIKDIEKELEKLF